MRLALFWISALLQGEQSEASGHKWSPHSRAVPKSRLMQCGHATASGVSLSNGLAVGICVTCHSLTVGSPLVELRGQAKRGGTKSRRNPTREKPAPRGAAYMHARGQECPCCYWILQDLLMLTDCPEAVAAWGVLT